MLPISSVLHLYFRLIAHQGFRDSYECSNKLCSVAVSMSAHMNCAQLLYLVGVYRCLFEQCPVAVS